MRLSKIAGSGYAKTVKKRVNIERGSMNKGKRVPANDAMIKIKRRIYLNFCRYFGGLRLGLRMLLKMNLSVKSMILPRGQKKPQNSLPKIAVIANTKKATTA